MLALVIALLVAPVQWVDVCKEKGNEVPYCADVGKAAYNRTGCPGCIPSGSPLADVRLGTIVGVAWRPKGSIISLPDFPVRTSPRDAYYYIIDDGGEMPFIRQCREIRPR